MTKKSFADEIATGMSNELQPEIEKQASVNLVKAVDYLNTAFEILDEAGFLTQADQVLDILCKLAGDSLRNVAIDKDSPFKALLDAGITHKDIISFSKGNQFAIAKVNLKLRELGYNENQVKSFLDKYYMTIEEVDQLLTPNRSFTKIDEFIRDPFSVPPNKTDLKPGDEFVISTLASHHKNSNSNTKKLNVSNDLLNLEVNDEQIEVSDSVDAVEMDFEDEI